MRRLIGIPNRWGFFSLTLVGVVFCSTTFLTVQSEENPKTENATSAVQKKTPARPGATSSNAKTETTRSQVGTTAPNSTALTNPTVSTNPPNSVAANNSTTSSNASNSKTKSSVKTPETSNVPKRTNRAAATDSIALTNSTNSVAAPNSAVSTNSASQNSPMTQTRTVAKPVLAKNESATSANDSDSKPQNDPYIDAEDREFFQTLVDAYIYATPLVLTGQIERETTNGVFFAPVNKMSYIPTLPTPAIKLTECPNVDGLTSFAWLDLTKGPQVVCLPVATKHNFVLEILNAWTEVVETFSNDALAKFPIRKIDDRSVRCFIVANDAFNEADADGIPVVRSTTETVWLVNRVLLGSPRIDRESDVAAASRVLYEFEVVALDVFLNEFKKPEEKSVEPSLSLLFQPLSLQNATSNPKFADSLTLSDEISFDSTQPSQKKGDRTGSESKSRRILPFLHFDETPKQSSVADEKNVAPPQTTDANAKSPPADVPPTNDDETSIPQTPQENAPSLLSDVPDDKASPNEKKPSNEESEPLSLNLTAKQNAKNAVKTDESSIEAQVDRETSDSLQNDLNSDDEPLIEAEEDDELDETDEPENQATFLSKPRNVRVLKQGFVSFKKRPGLRTPVFYRNVSYRLDEPTTPETASVPTPTATNDDSNDAVPPETVETIQTTETVTEPDASTTEKPNDAKNSGESWKSRLDSDAKNIEGDVRRGESRFEQFVEQAEKKTERFGDDFYQGSNRLYERTKNFVQEGFEQGEDALDYFDRKAKQDYRRLAMKIGAAFNAERWLRQPVQRVQSLPASEFFVAFAELLKNNPPLAGDEEMVAKLAKIGIVPGESFDPAKLTPKQRHILRFVAPVAQHRIQEAAIYGTGRKNLDGRWVVFSDLGKYGTDYMRRAIVATEFIGANVAQYILYPYSMVDGEGNFLNGRNDYILRFPPGQTPPARTLWSLTIYNDERFLVPNRLRRYAIRSDQPLVYNEDGSLDLYIQNKEPQEKVANWLPAPEGEFILMLRIYSPKESALDGTWTIPPVQKTRSASESEKK